MSPLQQALANLADSRLTTGLGFALIAGGILCDSGVFSLYLSPTSATAWCTAIQHFATYIGGPALLVSRSPTTPPR